MASAKEGGAKLALVKTTDYEGPDRRSPTPPRAYDKNIDNSAARLPPITSLGRSIVEMVNENMSPKEVAVLALHLNHRLRSASIDGSRKATADGDIEKGTPVRLVRLQTVSAKHEGTVGIVQKVSKLRCFVKVRGMARPFYVYLAEVERLTPAQARKAELVKDGAPKKKATAKKGSAKKDTQKAAKKKVPSKKEEPADAEKGAQAA